MSDGYFGKHMSLSGWVLQSELPTSEAIVSEDGDKHSRLQLLSEEIDLPIVHNYTFTTQEVLTPSQEFAEFRKGAGSTLYAARGRSSEDGKPVLRKRGVQIDELVSWIRASDVDLDSYGFSFEKHIDAELATIFVVGETRIAGEAIVGGILSLNSGNFTADQGHAFEYESGRWTFLSEPEQQLKRFLRQALACVRVDDNEVRDSLSTKLNSTFNAGHISGYFEAISSSASGLVFIDYNRVMSADLPSFSSHDDSHSDPLKIVEGRIGCKGRVVGRARVFKEDRSGNASISADEVLVCRHTDPEFLP
ncbi:MAG: hypothetical protein AB2692_11770, partial [Candidatus Thiodiazotropha sp.]